MPLFGEDVLDAIQTPEGIARLMRGAPPVTDVLDHLKNREGIARLLGRPESDMQPGAMPLPAVASGSVAPASSALAPAQPQAAAALAPAPQAAPGSTGGSGLINSTLAGIGPGINQAAEEASSLRPGWQSSVGGVRVGPEMSGRDVLARSDLTPASRAFFERAEAGRQADLQNPIIQSLGGTQAPYGESGGIPTLNQASSRLGRDLSPAEYAALMRVGAETGSSLGQTAINRGHLGVSQQVADQANPTHASQTEADRRGAALLAESITRIRNQTPHLNPEQVYRQAAGENGMSLERAMTLLGATPLPRSSPAAGPLSAGGAVPASIQSWTPAPQGVNQLAPPQISAPQQGAAVVGPPASLAPQQPSVNNFSQTPVSGGAAKPWQNIEQQLNSALGQVPVSANTTLPNTVDSRGIPKNADIGEFINRLETQQPGLLAARWPDIQRYLTDRLGESAVESALRASGNSRQIDPGASLLSRIVSPAAWLQGARQQITGPNDSERGLSALGSLMRAINRSGSHDRFLQQQRNPPTE